jgi:hypothetical protein
MIWSSRRAVSASFVAYILRSASGWSDGDVRSVAGSRAPGTGGTSEDGWTEWLLIAADLDRAQAAGCRTTEETARFLCPWTVVVENIRDEGREARGES